MVYYILMSLTKVSQHTQDIGWLRSITNLPILIKGVLTREDGRLSILWYLHLIIIILSLLLLMKMVRSSFITDIHISILHLPYFFPSLSNRKNILCLWNFKILMKISVNHPFYLWNFKYRRPVNHPDCVIYFSQLPPLSALSNIFM